jgi:hypothetical protein
MTLLSVQTAVPEAAAGFAQGFIPAKKTYQNRPAAAMADPGLPGRTLTCADPRCPCHPRIALARGQQITDTEQQTGRSGGEP